MKYLAFLVLTLILSCRISSPGTFICKNFEEDVRINWKRPEGNWIYYFASDSLVKNLSGKYRGCILGKDSSYIVNCFGPKYGWTGPICYDSSRESMQRKFGME